MTNTKKEIGRLIALSAIDTLMAEKKFAVKLDEVILAACQKSQRDLADGRRQDIESADLMDVMDDVEKMEAAMQPLTDFYNEMVVKYDLKGSELK